MPVEVADDKNFGEELQNNDVVVVKYFADWCGVCRLISSKYKKLSEDERFAEVKFLDVNAEQNPEARKLANVSNLPTFAVFRKGELVKADFTSKIDAVEKMIAEGLGQN